MCAQLLLGASLALLPARRQLLEFSSETYEGGRERRSVWSGRPIQNEILKKNVESYDYVACINAALYNKETEVILEHPPFSNSKQKSQNFNESFRISNKKNLINTEKVKTVTMSKIIDEYQLKRINILKLDIEGAEKYIFDNTADNWINKVDVLIFECPDNDFGAEGVTQQIFNIISKNNLKFKSHICGENLILIKFDTNYFLEQKVYLI